MYDRVRETPTDGGTCRVPYKRVVPAAAIHPRKSENINVGIPRLNCRAAGRAISGASGEADTDTPPAAAALQQESHSQTGKSLLTLSEQPVPGAPSPGPCPRDRRLGGAAAERLGVARRAGGRRRGAAPGARLRGPVQAPVRPRRGGLSSAGPVVLSSRTVLGGRL